MTHNGQGLAMWRYSIIRQPELLLSIDMKMKIYFIAGLYSKAGHVDEYRYIDEDIFLKPPYS